MQEMDAKRSTKLPQRGSAEENDRADTLSDACQVGDTDGDVPVTQSKLTKSAEAPEATQEAPLMSDVLCACVSNPLRLLQHQHQQSISSNEMYKNFQKY